jgi:predicted transcriptional regulator
MLITKDRLVILIDRTEKLIKNAGFLKTLTQRIKQNKEDRCFMEKDPEVTISLMRSLSDQLIDAIEIINLLIFEEQQAFLREQAHKVSSNYKENRVRHYLSIKEDKSHE